MIRLKKIGSATLVAVLSAGTLTVLPGCATSSTSEKREAGEYVDDAVISTRVKSAFVADKEVKLRNIEVETYRGIVQLSGFADSDAEASRAVELAKGVKGVKEVKNDIRLKQ